MRYHLYGRTTYVDPLEHLGDVEQDTVPTLDDVEVRSAEDAEWIELVALPADDVVWILRDGELVRDITTDDGDDA